MPQASFTFNGEQYVVNSDTNPPSLWRMSAQGPVLMSTSNPGWGGPELRRKMNDALTSLGSQPNAAPRTPSSAQGGQGVAPPAATPTTPSPNTIAPDTRITEPPLNAYGTVGEPSANMPPGSYSSSPTSDTPTQESAAAAQARILNSVQRPGWTVTGVTDEVKTRTNDRGITETGPTGNKVWAITGPGGKNDTITVGPGATAGDWQVVKPPSNASAAAVLTPKDAVYVKGEGYFLPIDPSPDKLGDPNNWKKVLRDGVPNADEEITKAVDRQVAEGDRNARQRNEQQYGIYADDATAQRLMIEWGNQGLRGQELQQKKDEFNKNFAESQRQFDIKQADTDKKTQDALLTGATNRALTTARTAGQEATTAATQSTTAINQAKLPGELERQQADIAEVRARTANQLQATQIAGAPQLQQNSLTQSLLTQVDPRTGAVTQGQMNLAYTPKTQAEIAARAGQIHSLMQQKNQQVQSKVGQVIAGKQYTPDDALKEFNTWYDAQVAPQTDALRAAQDEAAFQLSKDLAAMRTSAYTAANAASTASTNAFNALRQANPIDNQEDFAAGVAQLAKGKVPAKFATWTGPDPVAASQMAVANALKYIDPASAAATGAPMPNYQQVDIRGLTANPYLAPGVPVPGPTPAPAAVATAVPAQPTPAPAQPASVGGAPQEFWDKLFGRIRSDQADQAVQAAAMPQQVPPGMFNPQFANNAPSAVGQPAMGPVAGLMPDWLRNGTPPPPPGDYWGQYQLRGLQPRGPNTMIYE